MIPQPESDIPLLPIHDSKTPAESSNNMGANLPRRSPFKLTDITVNIPSSKKRPLTPEVTVTEERPTTPRWATLEFKAYYVIALIVIPIMVWVPISISSDSHPNFPFYQSKLTGGWIFGRFVDNSDAQYRTFRNNIPILSIAIILHLSFKYIVSVLPRRTQAAAPRKFKILSPATMEFNLIFSLVAVVLLHGFNALKIMLILFLNYSVARSFQGSKSGAVLTWVFNGAVLLGNEAFEGWRFSQWFENLAWLDSYAGIYPRWHIIFNITMLRLVSFNLDYHWACNRGEKVTEDVEEIKELSEKYRQSISHPDEVYSFSNLVTYALYPPLYIAGPIITFNDFMWQHRYPNKQPLTSTPVKSYIIRFIFSLLTMEFVLHFMYVVAIKDRKAWVGFTPAEISMVGFWNLIIMWLKLLIPWRFFRLWALLDGVDPPENMVRCMANNYSTMGFWRSWHRSYNLWIIRYIYIPLGGAKNLVINTVIVFSFVALWHDLTFRLLAWGWLISLFIIPELVARWLVPSVKYGHKVWYRHLAALGAVANILMMMGANLVGFVIGTEGTKFFISEVFGTVPGLKFLLAAIAILFVGVQLMFEYREEEHRQGIYRRC